MQPRNAEVPARVCVDEMTGLVLGLFGEEAAKADSVPPGDGLSLLDSLEELSDRVEQ